MSGEVPTRRFGSFRRSFVVADTAQQSKANHRCVPPPRCPITVQHPAGSHGLPHDVLSPSNMISYHRPTPRRVIRPASRCPITIQHDVLSPSNTMSYHHPTRCPITIQHPAGSYGLPHDVLSPSNTPPGHTACLTMSYHHPTPRRVTRPASRCPITIQHPAGSYGLPHWCVAVKRQIVL